VVYSTSEVAVEGEPAPLVIAVATAESFERSSARIALTERGYRFACVALVPRRFPDGRVTIQKCGGPWSLRINRWQRVWCPSKRVRLTATGKVDRKRGAEGSYQAGRLMGRSTSVVPVRRTPDSSVRLECPIVRVQPIPAEGITHLEASRRSHRQTHHAVHAERPPLNKRIDLLRRFRTAPQNPSASQGAADAGSADQPTQTTPSPVACSGHGHAAHRPGIGRPWLAGTGRDLPPRAAGGARTGGGMTTGVACPGCGIHLVGDPGQQCTTCQLQAGPGPRACALASLPAGDRRRGDHPG
jgi:hypothetical protein